MSYDIYYPRLFCYKYEIMVVTNDSRDSSCTIFLGLSYFAAHSVHAAVLLLPSALPLMIFIRS